MRNGRSSIGSPRIDRRTHRFIIHVSRFLKRSLQFYNDFNATNRPNVVTVPETMKSYLSSNRLRRDLTAVSELEVLHTPIEDAYTEAYKTGKEGKCWTRYYSCPISVFKIYSS